jgi:hypothetical protein
MSEAAAVARALRGKRIADGYLCRCPVPSHGKGRGDREPSLLVKDGTRALLVKCFAGCDPRDILDELRGRNLAAVKATHAPDLPIANCAPAHAPNPEALALWGSGSTIKPGSLQARYLTSRGLTIAPPPSLRAVSVLHLDRYPFEALVAAVQAPDRRTIAVQRTLLDPRGDRKAQVRIPRMTVGALGWGAVRLAAAADVLGLAEGVEKGLAAMQLFGVPCWVSLGATRMHRVAVPDTVHELHLFMDNDDAGRAAGERTAHAHRHRKVVLRFPPDGCKDWDDVTRAQAQQRGAA